MNKGFSLIELLAVTLILGILISIAMPMYTRAVTRSEMMEAMMNVRSMYDSAVRYKSVNSEYPTKLNEIDIGFYDASSDTAASFSMGGFTYNLKTDAVSAQKFPAGSTYEFIMYYPQLQADGSYLGDTLCIPQNQSFQWLCQSFGGAAKNGGYEIR